MTDKSEKIENQADPLAAISDTLIEISETLESLLMLFQQREEAFKARKSFDRPSFGGGDRRPPFRKSFDRDNEGGGDFERKPYRKPYERDDRGGGGGDRKPYAPRGGSGGKSFGDRKPYTPRDGGGDRGPKKTYKGGY